MAFHKEKRKYERHKADASIICSYYNQNHYYPGRMMNYSRNGMYFESDYPFKPGAYIYIRLESDSVDSCEGFRTLSLAKVKWCRNTGDIKSARHGIGVRYLNYL